MYYHLLHWGLATPPGGRTSRFANRLGSFFISPRENSLGSTDWVASRLLYSCLADREEGGRGQGRGQTNRPAKGGLRTKDEKKSQRQNGKGGQPSDKNPSRVPIFKQGNAGPVNIREATLLRSCPKIPHMRVLGLASEFSGHFRQACDTQTEICHV